MRVRKVAVPTLALILYLSSPAGIQAQTSRDGSEIRTRLTLNLRHIAISYSPALAPDQPEHRRLLSGVETSTVPRVRIAELDASTLLRMGTLDGTVPDDDANETDSSQPSSRKYDLWLTRPPRASRDGDAWRLELNTPGETGISALIGMVPLTHATRDESVSLRVALFPTAEDAGQLVLRWDTHRWTADFSFAAPPEPPDQTEEERAEARRQRNEQNRRDFDSDTSGFARFVRLGERHETAIELPSESRIDVLFWKKIGADHDDFSAIPTLDKGGVVRLTEAAVLRLRTEVGLHFGDVDISTDNLAPDYPGLYGLWIRRAGNEWWLVFNHEADSWGTQHDPAFDAAEVPLRYTRNDRATRPLGAVLIPRGTEAGTLVLHWGPHEWSADFTIDWEVSRLADGQPDLQGIWTNATLTPIERPDSLAETAVLTAREASEFETTAAERRAASDRFIPGNVGAYNQFWMDGGKVVTGDRRTALIIEPPDGRIPWSQAGRERLAADSTRYGVGPYDSWDDTDTGERCLTDGLPFVPLQGYNMNYHILQAPGWVAILNEMFHEYRLIPTDGRSHVPTAIGQWLGDARGRWEGDTLVVETTNFADLRHYLFRATWRGARPGLRLVERFTRVDDETIDYEFTMTDPEMFSRPWTALVPMTTNHASRGVTSGPMYEYACHEGNYGLLNILRGARVQEGSN